jgi:hypothetical protein
MNTPLLGIYLERKEMGLFRKTRKKISVAEAQSEIDGLLVAKILMDFHTEFRDVYPDQTHVNLAAVGPIHSLIGLAIKNGYLKKNNEQKF